jgi:hypothetical protein
MIVLKFDLPQSFRKSKAMTYSSKLGISFGMVGFLTMWLMVVPLQAESPGAATTPATTAMTGKTWAQKSTVEKIQLICALSALPVFFVAEIMFIVAGFKTSTGWGLFMLFIGGLRSIFAALAMISWMIQWVWLTHQSKPFQVPGLILGGFIVIAGTGAIVFIIRHWTQARRPLAVMAIGMVLILAVLALQFAK